MSITAPHATVLLEFSEDALSDTTPTYVDVTVDLIDWEFEDGKNRDLDEPQAGSLTLRLRNRNRQWEPEFTGGPYYPNVVPLRRFRLSLDGTPRFLGYATSYDVQYVGGTEVSEVVVTCADGHAILSLDTLALLDPPSASSLEEVIMHDEPFAYYKNGEKAGTKAEPVTGPEGVYKNTPTLGQRALVTGEAGTSVLFASASSERMEATVDSGKFADTNQFTLEAVVRGAETMSAVNGWAIGFAGGAGLGKGDGGFWTGTATAGTIEGTTGYNEDETHHLVLTWTGMLLSLYVDGALEATSDSAPVTQVGGTTIYIGRGAAAEFFGGYVQHAVFYEHALTAERIAAHYAAVSSGFAQQTAGARVSAVATSDLWSEASIQTGAHDVQPVMEHGQSKIDEIKAAVRAEMPSSLFFFEGDGDPAYLGWEYKAAAPYNEPQAILGDTDGEVPYQSIGLVYDDQMFNEVTVSHQTDTEGEASHTVEDATSIAAYRRRAHAETGLILVHHHAAEAVAGAILANVKDPRWRVQSISLNGKTTAARAQIKARKIGDCIRVRRRGEGGTPIDIITWILGRQLSMTRDGHLYATWQTARGFNASVQATRAGIVGFSEAGVTTYAG